MEMDTALNALLSEMKNQLALLSAEPERDDLTSAQTEGLITLRQQSGSYRQCLLDEYTRVSSMSHPIKSWVVSV